MAVSRRAVMTGAAALPLAAASSGTAGALPGAYGLVGRMKALPGRRGELAAILGAGTRAMPGCLSYVVAEDLADADALIVTEVWRSREDHLASLKLPAVRAAIARGRPLIAAFETLAETHPLSGLR